MGDRRRNAHPALNMLKRNPVSAAILGLLLVIVLCFCVVRCSSGQKDYSDFLDALGQRESSDRYDAENRFGYLGRYQMGELALREAGFMDTGGKWTRLANSYGISSKADFLLSAEGQDASVRACHIRLCGYIQSYGLERYVGTRYCGVKVTKSGLLAACHLVGIGSLSAALERNEPVRDANGVPASEYMEHFAGYDISEVWD